MIDIYHFSSLIKYLLCVITRARCLGVSNASFLNKHNIFEQNFAMNDDVCCIFSASLL